MYHILTRDLRKSTALHRHVTDSSTVWWSIQFSRLFRNGLKASLTPVFILFGAAAAELVEVCGKIFVILIADLLSYFIILQICMKYQVFCLFNSLFRTLESAPLLCKKIFCPCASVMRGGGRPYTGGKCK